jgi:hypothetical protein
MAQPLSFLIEVKAGEAPHVARRLGEAFTGPAEQHPLPNIVHYLWLLEMPQLANQELGTKHLLLNTVYDEKFKPYVTDIAKQNHVLFDKYVLPNIIGMEGMVPVLDHLDEFADFIEAHDLTGGGTIPTFKQNYNDTVIAIWRNT